MNLVIVVLLGLGFGSFANVCIYRWPRNLSIWRPARSFCPWCKTRLHWYDNVPLLSYLALRGRCRGCRSPISVRYPIVEAAVAVSWIAAWLLIRRNEISSTPFVIGSFTFFFVIVVTTLTDLDWKIIPDETTMILFSVSLVTCFWNPFLVDEGSISAVGQSLLGAAVGAAVLLLIGATGRVLFGKEAMGGGDIKLLGGFGAFFGWHGAISILLVASLIGSIVATIGLVTGRMRRGQYIPFGPFLNLAAVLEFIFRTTSQHFSSTFEIFRSSMTI